MIIGQTHKVDLAHPVDYQPGTIYKYGSVVKSQGNLYVASAFIPAVDPGPGKSTLWEQVSEAPEISTAPAGYVDAVNDLGWDNTGETEISQLPSIGTNIFFPAGKYVFARSVTNLTGHSLKGETPQFYPHKLQYSNQYAGSILMFMADNDVEVGTNGHACNVENLHFKSNSHGLTTGKRATYSTITFKNCLFDTSGGALGTNGLSYTQCINCSFLGHPTYVISTGSVKNDFNPVLYDCNLLDKGTLDFGKKKNLLGQLATWYNPVFYGITADNLDDTTVYNPTYR